MGLPRLRSCVITLAVFVIVSITVNSSPALAASHIHSEDLPSSKSHTSGLLWRLKSAFQEYARAAGRVNLFLQPARSSHPLQHPLGQDYSAPPTQPDYRTPFEWNAITISSLFLAACCGLLANSAGIGGGAFFMPLLNSVLGFNLFYATGLSHSLVAASGIASTIYAMLQPSPVDPSMPLIDLSIVVTFIPPLLFGVGLGLLVNPLLPSWLQVSALALLLGFMTRETTLKSRKAWQKETADQAKARAKQVAEAEAGPPGGVEGSAAAMALTNSERGFLNGGETGEGGEEEEDRVLIWMERGRTSAAVFWAHTLNGLKPLISIISLWLVFLLLQYGLSLSQQCTPSFFLFWAGQVALCSISTAFMLYYRLKTQGSADGSLSQPLLVGEPSKDASSDYSSQFLKVVAVMIFAGIIGGLLGIGGAALFNPFLLSLGIHPQVVASTSVMMILFSSSAISLSYFFRGFLNLSYLQYFIPVVFVSSFLGVTAVGRIVKKTGRASIVIIILAAIMGAGTVLTGILGGAEVLRNIRNGTSMWFRDICTPL